MRIIQDFWVYFFRVIVPALITIGVGFFLQKFLSSRISSFGEKKNLPESHVYAVKLITRWIIVIGVILALVNIFGFGVGRLWIVISSIAAMIIIGFVAVWSVLGNTLSSLILMIWRPFEVGDNVDVLPEGISGRVFEINLFFTRLRTEEGNVISVPNSVFMGKFIKVLSESEDES
ncbi:MAG: mechanosensitive ion channel family protein [Hadesarchaea archaeon]|nr:mechanosensitive ion channel family protein [Hadesarchaea archaeon]